VADSIGEAYLGDFARHQLEAARRDPRVDRSRGAMVADFFAAMEEAERWREMTTWGLDELAEAVEQEERRLRVCRDDSDLTPEQRRSLQAAWERIVVVKRRTLSAHWWLTTWRCHVAFGSPCGSGSRRSPRVTSLSQASV
jgi:hypothetical protein